MDLRGERFSDDPGRGGYDSAGTSTFSASMGPLSEITRVCTYDRAGTGTSDHRPDGLHVTSLLEAKELHALLEGAAIAPPYFVVAHSYGGFIGRLFAATYPAETVGLALVDSSHEDEIGPYRRCYGNSAEGDWVDGGDLIDIDATRRELRSTARDYATCPSRWSRPAPIRTCSPLPCGIGPRPTLRRSLPTPS